MPFNTSKKNLKILASLVWCGGIVALSIKSALLLQTANNLNPNIYSILLAVFAGLAIGVIKTKFLFRGLCLKNLHRIDALKQPKLWQFYRPYFFVFLISMIILGSYLSRIAQDNYSLLLTMAIIELSIATALLGSSHYFWKRDSDVPDMQQ